MAHSVHEWYKRYRRGNDPEKAERALYLAKIHAEAEQKTEAVLAALTAASRGRIEGFVDNFIRGPEVEGLTSDRDSDFINERDRAARCYDAAEHGADGKTHAEVIEDWRDAFKYWISDKRNSNDHSRFEDAVEARFSVTELWHEFNGSLHQEIG